MTSPGRPLGARLLAGGALSPPRGVGDSPDWRRVASLPWRLPAADLPPDVLSALVRSVTGEYALPGGKQTLRPLQAAALAEIREGAAQGRRGLLGPLGVGSGKTLISLLAPRAARARRPLLFTYASLVAKTHRDREAARAHWDLGPADDMPVVSWESLSRDSGIAILLEYQPDIIIADEAHALRGAQSARTGRFLRYFTSSAGEGCALVALSGTLTSRSLADYAAVSELALGEYTPLPRDPHTLAEWDRALGESVHPRDRLSPGVLAALAAPGETVRAGWYRRLVGTPGVVATTADALGTALDITLDRTGPGARAAAAARAVAESGQCPITGREYESPAHVAQAARLAGLGATLVWEWPGGEPDYDWLAARNGWARAVRAYLDSLPEGAPEWESLDSPGRLAAALRTQTGPAAADPALRAAWAAWAPFADRPPPPVAARLSTPVLADVAQAITDWVAAAAAGRAGGPGLVWVPSPHLGPALSRLTGLDWYGPGSDIPPSFDSDPECRGAVLVSQGAHSVGKNLQGFSRNLVLSPPASPDRWEQLLGRTHRPGQRADSVAVTVWVHHKLARAAWTRARAAAEYVQATTGQSQKLLAATLLDD